LLKIDKTRPNAEERGSGVVEDEDEDEDEEGTGDGEGRGGEGKGKEEGFMQTSKQLQPFLISYSAIFFFFFISLARYDTY
jgi:hypothetical protein